MIPTCGPTCLHAVYHYFGYDLPLQQVIDEVHTLEGGGTLAVYLGLHALEHDFQATLYTYNLQVFDPSWFTSWTDLRAKLKEQLRYKHGKKFQQASQAYREFLAHGGIIRFEDLTHDLLRRYLKQEVPILTGLSATYLYNCARELAIGDKQEYDDVRGESAGHFVVLTGYSQRTRTVCIADPLRPNPVSENEQYEVSMSRLICAILLGILTYDANLLLITPSAGRY